jgi:hypothetical protein
MPRQLVARRASNFDEQKLLVFASDWGPNLDPYPDAGEPLLRKASVDGAYPGGVYNFLLRFDVVLAIFVLALLIAYLAR